MIQRVTKAIHDEFLEGNGQVVERRNVEDVQNIELAKGRREIVERLIEGRGRETKFLGTNE